MAAKAAPVTAEISKEEVAALKRVFRGAAAELVRDMEGTSGQKRDAKRAINQLEKRVFADVLAVARQDDPAQPTQEEELETLRADAAAAEEEARVAAARLRALRAEVPAMVARLLAQHNAAAAAEIEHPCGEDAGDGAAAGGAPWGVPHLADLGAAIAKESGALGDELPRTVRAVKNLTCYLEERATKEPSSVDRAMLAPTPGVRDENARNAPPAGSRPHQPYGKAPFRHMVARASRTRARPY